jgi:hypothetical protein
MTRKPQPGKRAQRRVETNRPDIGSHRAKHLSLARVALPGAQGADRVTVNESESPLAWLARRKGRDGRFLIDATQFAAGERLRAEFTRAHAMPRMGADWSSPIGSAHGGGDARSTFSEVSLAARQRLRHALYAVGPEFSGILLDICCFLKGLEDVEIERGWPARSGKVILQLALDRLARHYRLETQAKGPARSGIRAWSTTELDSGSGEGGVGVGADTLDH